MDDVLTGIEELRRKDIAASLMRILKRQPDGSWRVHRSIFAEAAR